MKKIFLILPLTLSLLTTSCEDAIDIVQGGETSEDIIFENVDDLQTGIYYVYGMLDNTSQISLSSIWTDEVGQGTANGGRVGNGTYSFVMTSGSAYASGIWENNYDVINIATRLIVAAENITPAADEQDTYNDIIAQARALRAYANFNLLTYFSTDLTDDSALGVMKLDHVPTISETFPRVSNGEIFDYIEEDLAFAEANLASQSDVTYITDGFITALEARIALYRGQYDVAEDLADDIIAAYPLTNRTLYPYIWTDDVPGEVIFKLERTTVDATIGSIWFNLDANADGAPYWEIGRSLFNQLDPNDVRYDAIVGDSSEPNPNYTNSTNYLYSDILIVNKYPGSEGIKLLNDLKIFRASEAYFIKAECQTRNGDLTGAATTMQTLKTTRFSTGNAPTTSYSTATNAYRDILNQRRIEFAFEGYRYIDIKRLGTLAGVDIERDPMDCAVNGECSLSSDSYKLTLPIPSSEISANAEIADQQNPGY